MTRSPRFSSSLLVATALCVMKRRCLPLWTWLARLSQRAGGMPSVQFAAGLVLLPAVVPSCLLTEPPPYDLPQKIRPHLEPISDYPTTQILKLVSLKDLKEPQRRLGVTVRSEDANDTVRVFLYLDYGEKDRVDRGRTIGERSLGPGVKVEPSHWDAPCTAASCRRVYLSLPTDIAAGCHQVTAVATHDANIELGVSLEHPNNKDPVTGLKLFRDSSLLGLVTWWIWVVDSTDSEEVVTLDMCPGIKVLEPGAE